MRPRKLKTRTIISGAHAYFAVQDPMSGRRHVYTVYKIALAGDKNAAIIGRELPLPVARKVIHRHAEAQ
jgi:hypothetical protein